MIELEKLTMGETCFVTRHHLFGAAIGTLLGCALCIIIPAITAAIVRFV